MSYSRLYPAQAYITQVILVFFVGGSPKIILSKFDMYRVHFERKNNVRRRATFQQAARFLALMRTSHNAIPEPCTTMELVVVPQVSDERKNNKHLSLIVLFRAKYTEINQEKVTQNTSNIQQKSFF